MENQKIRVDGIDWHIHTDTAKRRHPQPLCPKHHLRLSISEYGAGRHLVCEDCDKAYELPRDIYKERQYVLNKIDAKVFKGMKVLNLDDESVPLVEEKLTSEDKKYFVTGKLTKSKVGLRLVLYAGKRGDKQKTQIFVEPEIKRLAFDQNDLHPSDVFTKVEATFPDMTKNSIEKKTKPAAKVKKIINKK